MSTGIKQVQHKEWISTRAYGVVVSHPLRMRKALCSIPSVSNFIGAVFLAEMLERQSPTSCRNYVDQRLSRVCNNTTQHNTSHHNLHKSSHHISTHNNTTQHNTTQHNTTQHNTTQHNTTQHSTTQNTLLHFPPGAQKCKSVAWAKGVKVHFYTKYTFTLFPWSPNV